jgi:serine-type D-Ala-D-Ala endopeptidase (penicillin-binding protein 7)
LGAGRSSRRPSGEAGLKPLLLAVVLAGVLVTGPAAAQGVQHVSVRSPDLKSSSALVLDQDGGRVLFAKNEESLVPIASITKVMNAMVVLDSGLPLDELITITRDDIDGLKHTGSRLAIGAVVTRDDLLRLALMASENRAASALARSYPGGTPAFVEAMNRKATELGMWRSQFVDGTGLSSGNRSTASELARMVDAAYRYPLIREYSTQSAYTVDIGRGRSLSYGNSNLLVRNNTWHIGLSKTGYINEAGRCLVLQATIAATPVIIVLLDSWGRLTRIGDANRIKRWLETQLPHNPES